MSDQFKSDYLLFGISIYLSMNFELSLYEMQACESGLKN